VNSAIARAATIEVNTTADDTNAGDGSCTLREAINNANANSDTTNGDCLTGSPLPIIDAIAFVLPEGQQTIVPKSALPTITEAVVIDGTSQSGFAKAGTYSLTCPNPTGTALPPQAIAISRPGIELNGSSAGNVSGITINADEIVIRGLAINRFQRYGIEILNSSSRNVIDGNYIGTDISGTVALGNSRGIVIAAGNATNPNDNVIQNNVISGNKFLGVLVNGDELSDRRGNYIINNLIGTDYTGTQVLGNTQDANGHGVVIGQGSFTDLTSRYFSENNEIRGNVIAGSHTTNFWLSNYASNNLVECNYIGTDITGNVALGNCVDGLLVGGTQSNALSRLNKIRYNLIAGNAQCRGNTEANLTLQWGATDNTVENNLIGTDITGTRALSKSLSTDGIGLKQPANLIRNNVIGGHRRHGIHIYRGFGRQPSNNQIENNYIGIDPSGINIGNGGDGIAIFSNIYTPSHVLPPIDVRISGTQITGNAIANNGHNGVRIEARGDEAGVRASITNTQILDNAIHDNGANGIQLFAVETVAGATAVSIDNRIRTNRIFANGGLGISLSASIPSPHDVFLNGATGGALPANSPTANDVNDADEGANRLQNYPTLSSATLDVNTEVRGMLSSVPNTEFAIAFFANASAEPSNYGEGEISLGSISVTTNAKGKATFIAVLPPVRPGQWISATATDPTGNTSEFSKGILVRESTRDRT
jgi:titin